MTKRNIALYILFAVLGLIPLGVTVTQTISCWFVFFSDLSYGFDISEDITLAIIFTVIIIIECIPYLLTLIKYRRNIVERAVLSMFASFALQAIFFVAVLSIIMLYLVSFEPNIGLIIWSIATAIVLIGTLISWQRHLWGKKEIVGRTKALSVGSSMAVTILAVAAVLMWVGFVFELIPIWF